MAKLSQWLPWLVVIGACTLPVQTTTLSLQAGLPIAQLIKQYGKPHTILHTTPYPFYIWQLSAIQLLPARSARVTMGQGHTISHYLPIPKATRRYCKLQVAIDPKQQVVHHWQADGPACQQLLN